MPKHPRITLRFKGRDDIPCGILSHVMTIVDDAFYVQQREHLRAASVELDGFSKRRKTKHGPVDIPSIAVDAALHRLERYHGRALLIQRAESGSIILGGAVAALAYWLLDKTIGESVSEAWQRSELHSIVRDFFLMRFRGSRRDLADDLRRRLAPSQIIGEHPYSVEVVVHGSESNSPRRRLSSSQADEIEIIIEIHGDCEIPPTYERLTYEDGV